jgi:hypothetical protein
MLSEERKKERKSAGAVGNVEQGDAQRWAPPVGLALADAIDLFEFTRTV